MDFYLLFAFLGGLMAIFWFWQLTSLMLMSDDAFPGRYDKLIWAAILILLNALGAAVFVYWKWNMDAGKCHAQPGTAMDRAHQNQQA